MDRGGLPAMNVLQFAVSTALLVLLGIFALAIGIVVAIERGRH